MKKRIKEKMKKKLKKQKGKTINLKKEVIEPGFFA